MVAKVLVPLTVFMVLLLETITALPVYDSPIYARQSKQRKRATTRYTPVMATCPSTSLVRSATGISSSEESYRDSRYTIASDALSSWLSTYGFNVSSSSSLPLLGLTTSGGGYRSLLLGAGVIQGLDSRDSNASTSGLLQALTYQAGLSGGSWLLSSLVSNDYPTVSYLQENLWEQAFAQSLLIPGNILELPVTEAEIIEDVLSKQVAGYDTSFTDPWGRLLSYQLFEGDDGGVADTFSGVTALSSFINYSMPFPIITALGVKTFEGECLPGPNATQYEFSPYEFGSWDEGVEAFMQIHYLGTSLSNGQPDNGTCTTNFDNQGFILGTSSTLFNEYCTVLPEAVNSSSADIYEFIAAIESEINTLTLYDEYAKYPNPFYNYNSSTLVSEQTTLHLVDGGEALQNNPIWPLIHSARDVDVLFVNDNSADTSSNFPNGSEILTTYVQSLSAGLARMPYIPSVETFIDEGLNTRATFFGCNDTSKITIIYLPNVAYTYDSGQSTSKLEYTEEETAGMISNGVAIATQNGSSTWTQCLACGIMKKASSTLPSACTACLTKYCYN